MSQQARKSGLSLLAIIISLSLAGCRFSPQGATGPQTASISSSGIQLPGGGGGGGDGGSGSGGGSGGGTGEFDTGTAVSPAGSTALSFGSSNYTKVYSELSTLIRLNTTTIDTWSQESERINRDIITEFKVERVRTLKAHNPSHFAEYPNDGRYLERAAQTILEELSASQTQLVIKR